MKLRGVIANLLILTNVAQAGILRSSGLYYTPERQIEANVIAGYDSIERFNGFYQTKASYGRLGAKFEQGINPFLSWGAILLYGKGNDEISTQYLSNKKDSDGLFDPQIYLKSHYELENIRFHVNGIFALKADAMILSYDHSPINFSSGGSSLGTQLGIEGNAGPTILGADLYGDLWKDNQEVVEKNFSQSDTLYFRNGGKQLAVSVFGELNNFRYLKPGLRLRMAQLEQSKTELQDNQVRLASTVPSYSIPREQQMGASLYGRIRLPSHFVLNFELYGMNSTYDSSLATKNGTSYGVLSNIGYKF